MLLTSYSSFVSIYLFGCFINMNCPTDETQTCFALKSHAPSSHCNKIATSEIAVRSRCRRKITGG